MSNVIVKTLEDRYAGRAISSEPLDEEVINDLVEAARLTPSCMNKQPWRFLFLTGEEARSKGAEHLTGGNLKWAPRAPLLIYAYAKKEDDCVNEDGRAYYWFDVGMATMNIMLAATAHDLVARPMAGYKPESVKQTFDLDEDDEVIVAIAVGKLAEDDSHVPEWAQGIENKARVRKEASEIVTRL